MLAEAAALLALAAPGDAAHAFAVEVARGGARPAGSAAEARAQRQVADRFRAAGLTVRVQRFSTPRGRSRNVIGVREGAGDCLRVLMAHADSMPALRSPVGAPRRGVERELLRAAAPAGARLDWRRGDGTGNSDHRELELAGRRAVKLGGLDNPCRHQACDTPDRLRKGAFRVVTRLLLRVL